jgi:excisionase family DNA binding protein
MTTPFAMTIKSAAAYLDTDEKTIRQAIDSEKLPARRIGPKGGRWSVEVADLKNWYRNLGRELRDS